MEPLLTPEQQESFNHYICAQKHSQNPIPNPLVAYCGTLGSYAEEAAIGYFGKASRRLSHKTFEDVFKSITGRGADYGVLPIENSSTGSIASVYDLLAKYNCFIVGETEVKVEHCLMGIPGSSIDTIKEVYSHAQGFSQSEDYLALHDDWKCIPYFNTAIAAKYVSESGNLSFAAIASRRAADMHHLELLAENINYSDTNVTRFVIVSGTMENRPNRNKISIAFHVPHTSGALFHVLSIFDQYHLNLCKIESRPTKSCNWEYIFFIDFMSIANGLDLDTVIENVITQTEGFQFLGYYEQYLLS
ncbi:MAG: prephenate dehydratase [Eubacterium sp.]